MRSEIHTDFAKRSRNVAAMLHILKKKKKERKKI